MADGIYVSQISCGTCGAEITFDGGINDAKNHGWAGHGIPRPNPEYRIAELQAEKRRGRLEISS